MFVVNNKDQYKLNSEVHSINRKQTSNLYQPLTMYPKGTYYFGIKIFNNLLSDIKKLSYNVKQFILASSDILHLK